MAAFSIKLDLREIQIAFFLGSEARHPSFFSLYLKEAIALLPYKNYRQISIVEQKVIAENVNFASTRERILWPVQDCLR